MAEITTTRQESTEKLLSRPVLATMSINWEKAIYATFILLAVVTRLWGLGDRVMSHDESLHTQFSYQYFRGDGFNHTPLMHGPFLFHITPVFYWLFGASDFSARLPVAIFGVILVAMPYFLRSWLGRKGALFTSFFFLVSPFVTVYSRYIRHDIYVIVWAMILVIATWYYLRERQEKYLWWFAGALALMFATKEVAFIYTATFGSFLVVRLAVRLWQRRWFHQALQRMTTPLLVLIAAILLFGVGFGGLRLTTEASGPATATTTPAGDQGFAADPDQPATVAATQSGGAAAQALHWLQVVGAIGLGVAVFLAARELRPYLDDYAEFDLIVLYSTLILPMVSPFLVVLAGYNPTNYTINKCELAGQATMSPLQLFLARAGNAVCVSAFLDSPILRTGAFVVLTLVIGVLVGLWWNRRRWLIAAVIFHSIFFLLYTSLLTNPSGWASGTVGSLGYWLEQQEVQRGNQPWFYYLFLVPFYEFLPLMFSILAVRLWTVRHRLNRIAGYWMTLLLGTLLVYSLSNWFFNRSVVAEGGQPNNLAALIIAGILFLAGALYWFVGLQARLKARYDLGHRGWRELVEAEALVGFVPMLIWWLALTWIAYSYAGEKMPWLSTHFVIPMALLGGWYMNEKFDAIDLRAILSRQTLVYTGLAATFFIVTFLALKPLILGEMRFGNQRLENLQAIGGFLGMALLAGALLYLLSLVGRRLAPTLRNRGVLLAVFAVLSLLTVRFTYMAAWPNANQVREFMFYAHAAPSVKEVILPQLGTLSERLHGDKSIKVAWGDDGTWPIQWYLRDYPNRLYAGKNPSANITDYPVVIAGHRDLEAFENFLKDRDYQKEDYIFLWWPMEEYRQISWNGLFGLSNAPDGQGSSSTGRGILNPDVRQALWNIFFYRDYEKYSELFGNVYTNDRWRLRAELRLYIRRDVLANLWDHGTRATAIEPPIDPYAEGERQVTPDLVIGAGGLSDGELLTPRNLAIGPDGNLYVLDTGNHRLLVFDNNGRLLRSWGSGGTADGQFNEPWGIAVDEQFVYVADTWNHRVQKFTLDGQHVTTFGQSGSVAELGGDSPGYFFGPRSVALLANNRLLVTDTGNHRLQVFDRDGNFVQIVGDLGSEPGQFNEPVGLATGPEGRVFLADTWNARIQRFTSDLQPDFTWSVDAWQGDSTENKPYLAVDNGGRVYASDPENFRILVFGPDGQYLARFGQADDSIEGFGLPNGLAIDAQDNVYVADARNNRILRFPALELAESPSGSAEGRQPGDLLPGAGEEAEEGGGENNLPEPSPTSAQEE